MDQRHLALARRFAALPAEARRTLRARLAEQGLGADELPIPPRAEPMTPVLASYAQQRLWFLWQLDPASPAYNLAGGLRLTGALDQAALERTFTALVARHEPLRTLFSARDGAIWQHVQPAGPVTIEVEPIGPQALAAALAAEAARPFDLAQGPLLRVRLYRLGVREHVLLLAMHHIVSDGWSLGVLLGELVELYAAFARGVPSQLGALPIQYADYAIWQRQWNEAGIGERQLAFWRGVLGGEQPVLQLPADRPRPAERRGEGAIIRHLLSVEETSRLRVTAATAGTTVFVLLLAAFKLWLYRVTGQQDLRVGIPIANRTRAECEPLVGFFVNTQVFRSRIDDQTGFAELVAAIQQLGAEAQANQDLPFEQLVEALQPERSLSHAPLFQVMFNYEQQDLSILARLPGLSVEVLVLPPPAAKFDLSLDMLEHADGSLSASFTYATDIFEHATVERLLASFVSLLVQVAAEPRRQVWQYELVGKDEAVRLAAWNSTATPVADPPRVHRHVEAQARQHPERLALVFEGTHLSYAELNARANRVAHGLREAGVGPDTLVGIAAERSVAMVVGLLGVLKAGGAYVPLDPDYPQERLAFMLADSGARLLLTQAHLLPMLPATTIPIVCLDRDWDRFASYPEDDPADTGAGAHLAYCIYTSGTTGRPKGAGNTHAALWNRLQWMQQEYGLDADDRVLQKTPFSFDVSVWEFLWPLMTGATLVMAPPGAHRDPVALRDVIVREAITVLHFVPSMLQAFLTAEDIGACASLRHVICSGEALSHELQRRFLAASGASLHNLYGPTEAAIDVSFWACGEEPGHTAVPIGRPIANTRLYVLDAHLRPMPTGVTGELYIGGLGLARGYHRRPALTAERFVPDSSGSGERLYRTGDLARWRADGVLDYLGRVDQQVKIRGFRIEPGEIEARLLQEPAVQAAAVIAVDSTLGPRLVGYVAAKNEPGLVERLAERLRLGLPDHMVPSQLVVLDRLPLSTNGKLDRRELPAPEPQTRSAWATPVTPAERALVAIWQELLDRDAIGIDDNFFELGGDSIVSIQLVSRARQTGLHLRPRDIFQHQTIRALARALPEVQPAMAAAPEPEPATGDFLLTPFQTRFLASVVPQRHHWNQAVLLQPTTPLQPTALRQSFAALLATHDALRLRFVQDETGRWSAEHATTAASSELLRIRRADDAAAFATICADAQRSLNLAAGPLLRATLIGGEDGSERLLLVAHHLVVDGVSWRILLDDLQAAYRQALMGQPIRLPPRTTAFRAWTAHLHRLAHRPDMAAQLDWWCAALAEADPGFISDHPEAPGLVGDAVRIEVTLDQNETRELLTTAPQAYRTRPEELLLTALTCAAHHAEGCRSLLVELEGHGREAFAQEFDLDRTVGWLTCAYPVQLTPAAGPHAAILAIKEQLRAVPDKGAGYGILRQLGEAAAQARLASLPEPRITFNYLGQLDAIFAANALFRLAAEDAGPMADALAPLGNTLSIDGAVEDGRLRLVWTFSWRQLAPSRIEALAAAFKSELLALLAHCRDETVSGISPSDFPLAGLDQAQLDRLPVPARQIEDIYPVSAMQRGMLFECLYAAGAEHGRGTYVNQVCATIAGLDVARFAVAWKAVQDRHPVLRTSFFWEEGGAQPMQIVHRPLPLELREHDLRAASDEQVALADLVRQDRQEGFDLHRAPLMRLTLVRLADGRHHLIWTSHHLILDGWSAAQVMDEVLRHHAGRSEVGATGRYRDYIAWLQTRDTAGEEAFWRAQLASLDGPLHLMQALAGAAHGQGFGTLTGSLDVTAMVGLQGAARQLKVTLNTVVQAAWALLLQRYTGRADVVFGATVAGRPAELPGVERQIGLFINTLPVAAAPEPATPVGIWLQALQAQNLSLREHEHTPLADIQRWLGWSGEGAFDTILVFENYPLGRMLREAPPGGLHLSDVTAHEQVAYPLMIEVLAGERLDLHYRYDRQWLDDDTVAQIDRHLRYLLVGLAADPTRPVAAVPMLDDSERRAALTVGEAAATTYAANHLLHRLIERRARLQPWAIAAIGGEVEIGYADLNARANRLARRLRAAGVGPDTLVAVAMERSLPLLETLLAVLKAGGAYVPIDPGFPAERLGWMLADSGSRLLLTQSHLLAALPSTPEQLEVWCLDREEAALAGLSGDDLAPVTTGQHLAYVIYTSGSTGRPKGVAVRHAALVNFLTSMAREPGMMPGERILALTSLSFDIAGLELYLPLIAGGTVVLVDREAARDPALLWAAIERHDVGTIQATPSSWRMLVTDERLPALAGRRLLCGGEALPADLAARLLGAAGEVWNLYGPTETTIWSAVARLTPERSEVRLGGPIANTRLYVLDSRLEPVPPGVVGELYIGGDGLARGYHGRPDLTAETFVPDPFGPASARLYRTGDLVRRLADGTLLYIGRTDQQVKVRGFRIELGEIEARLAEHLEVHEAAVVARAAPGGQQLVAYVVADDAPDLSARLIAHLQTLLPDYMVPTQLVRLDAMPLTPNRKLDRKALPEAAGQAKKYAAPQGGAEIAIAQVWQQVLNVRRVGLDDNFFELGGDSIITIQVVSRLGQLGWSVTPRAIFDRPTVRALAGVAQRVALRGVYRPSTEPLVDLSPEVWAALPLPAAAIEDIYPLAPMQEGLLMHTLLEPGSGIYLMQNRHSIDGPIDLGHFDRAWSGVVTRNEALRSSFVWEQLDRPLQIIRKEAGEFLLHHDWRSLDAAEQRRRTEAVLEDELRSGMDMAGGPLFRVRLIRLADERFEMVVSYHHTIMDAWCLFLLLSDFVVFYRTLESGQEPVIQQAPPYRDFIRWLLQRDPVRTRAYWQELLQGVTAATSLPTDRPLALRQGHSRIIDRELRLSPAEDRALRTLAGRQKLTLNTFVQAAWALVLRQHSTQPDVMFGITVAGRPLELPELQGTLGLFINSIPLRVQVPGGAEATTVQAWLEALLEQNLTMREHEHLPLVEIHKLSGLPQGTALFDSLLVFENAPIDVTVVEGAEALKAAATGSRTHTNYPITVVAYPQGLLGLHLSCDGRFFDADTIERLLATFKRTLMALVEGFALPVRDLPLLDPTELQRLTVTCNATQRPYPLERGYAPLFRATVQHHPHRIAAACMGRRLTYAELDRQAATVAQALLATGPCADRVVAVLAARDLGFLAMVLGTLQAGAGYLGLDPAFPTRRLGQIMAAARPRAVVTEEAWLPLLEQVLAELPTAGRPPVLVLEQLAQATRHDPLVEVDGRHLAYVIYTSGSTGQPKGVMVEQAGMLNNQLSKIPGLGLGPADVIAQTAGQGFDISVWQLLAGLLCGARVEIVPDAVAHDPSALLEHARATGVTVLESVPSLIQGLLDAGPVPLPSLRWLLPTGEALPPVLARRWLERYPHVPLLNAYGPAECSDDVALHRIDTVPDEATILPIGRATDNNRLYLLDHALRPLPVGAVGELHVAGTGVGRGYLGDPARTAECFLPDPFAADGGRLYRTGDLARWNRRSQLEYLGRRDQQVKIRGFRIEPGEIEARLAEHHGVREAAVVVKDTALGPQLLGYVVPRSAENGWSLPQRLKSYLREHLPDYMVPARLALLKRLPLSANGKLDRAALPAIVWQTQEQMPPRTELEGRLVVVWQEVLQIDRVGITDDFYDLGGHSLLMTQIFARLRRDLAATITLRDVFEAATIEELAARIEAGRHKAITQEKASRLSALMAELESA
ncbi:MAG: amino acid adenylation domain-containing protein [Geminicoccaceae bacterium]